QTPAAHFVGIAPSGGAALQGGSPSGALGGGVSTGVSAGAAGGNYSALKNSTSVKVSNSVGLGRLDVRASAPVQPGASAAPANVSNAGPAAFQPSASFVVKNSNGTAVSHHNNAGMQVVPSGGSSMAAASAARGQSFVAQHATVPSGI